MTTLIRDKGDDNNDDHWHRNNEKSYSDNSVNYIYFSNKDSNDNYYNGNNDNDDSDISNNINNNSAIN